MLAVCVLVATASYVSAVDLTSNLVYDPTFYVNTHADLHHLNINTVSKATHHWLNTGIKEGRQGCGSFHSKQYLKRYSDLAKTYGTNYQKAIEHYLQHQSEKKLGYVDGEFDGRWTITNHEHDLFIGASRRMGGAIDSLVWGHKEFINSWDHGRELQMATNVHPFGECFNPTEAGAGSDSTGPSTKSRLQAISAKGNNLITRVHPAFWVGHGHSHHCPGGATHGLNTADVYPYDFHKNVTIGCAGLSNCIKYESTYTIDGTWPSGVVGHNFAAPTGYLMADFHVIKSLNLDNGQIQSFNRYKPVVVATADNKYAMGAYAPEGQDSDQPHLYSAHTFSTAFASGTTKWGAGFRKTYHRGHHKYSYVTYICVGDVNKVAQCLRHVHSQYPKV